MPFVKKVRDYYKDGVKVPSSSITDFGSYKYYKEFTTGGIELEYACYYSSGELGDEYYYAKAPIGNDLQIYGTRNKGVASSSSELGAAGTLVFSSLNEDTAVFGVTFNRYRDGDLYIDTTATEIVEVTAEDDYDFTEFVPSTEFDYYVDLNKLYQLAKPKRFYYDYSNEHNTKITGNRAIMLNGVASGFQTNTSINTVEAFAPAAGDTWEMMFKLRTGANVTTQQQFLGCVTAKEKGIEIAVESSKWKWWVGTGTSYNLASAKTGTYAVQPNTDYWIKVTYDGTAVTLYYSLDGVEFIQDLQVSTTSPIAADRKSFGCDAYQDSSPWLGSIDFNETYINLNGERWWDITKPYVRDGYWLIDGVASGWGGSIYLTAPFNIDIASGKEWEIVFKFKTGTNITTNQTVFSIPNWSLAFNIENSKTSFYLSSNGTSWNMASALLGTTTLETETWYYGKMSFNGNKYALALSKDGIDWTEESVLESTTPINNASQVFTIGRYSSSIAFANTGIIDLNESYIKINNRLWWHGTKVVEGDKDNYAFYEDRLLSYSPILKTGKQFTPLFESATGGTYEVTIPEDTNVRVTMVGGGGAAAIRGVYDDKGYGWSGGSGGAFIGTFALPKGTYSVTVGSANNNTKGQGGNSATLNPTDLTTHDSYIDGVVRVGGGGSGHYNSSYVGAAGAAATFDIEPLSITMNKAGNAGTSGSGGKGSAAAKTVSGGASVWGGYGKGQGCKTSEYASKRGWINGTGGYVRIEMWTQTGEQLY